MAKRAKRSTMKKVKSYASKLSVSKAANAAVEPAGILGFLLAFAWANGLINKATASTSGETSGLGSVINIARPAVFILGGLFLPQFFPGKIMDIAGKAAVIYGIGVGARDWFNFDLLQGIGSVEGPMGALGNNVYREERIALPERMNGADTDQPLYGADDLPSNM